jgi:FeS assembly SUF system protein
MAHTIRFDEQGRWSTPPEAAADAADAADAAVSDQAAATTPGPASKRDLPTEEGLHAEVVRAIKTVYDPEIPVNIWELGLIYDVAVADEGSCEVKMTLTSPACFAAQSIPGEVKQKCESVDGVTDANVEVVWDPPWNQTMMSEAAKLALNVMW